MVNQSAGETAYPTKNTADIITLLKLSRILSFSAIWLLSLHGLYGAENLQLGTNENLFAVLAAINAAGYDEGLALPDNSPLRKQLRDDFAKRNIAVLPELARYY